LPSRGRVELTKMDIIYLDTSALAKAYLEESEAEKVRMTVYSPDNQVFTSRVAFGELIRVLRRKTETISDVGTVIRLLYGIRLVMADFDQGTVRIVEPTEDRVAFFMLVGDFTKAHGKLGAPDVWHLMAMTELITIHQSASFLTFDKGQATAAKALGFPLYPL